MRLTGLSECITVLRVSCFTAGGGCSSVVYVLTPRTDLR